LQGKKFTLNAKDKKGKLFGSITAKANFREAGRKWFCYLGKMFEYIQTY